MKITSTYKGRDIFRRILLQFIVSLIVLLTACLNEKLLFSGEGEKWSADFIVSHPGSDEVYTIKLAYKGDDLKAIETFSYMVKSSYDGVVDYGMEEVSLDENGIYIGTVLTSNMASTTSEDELIVEVVWNGESESFDLTGK